MLYSSQQEAKALLIESLASNPLCVLQGMSGSGKSLVAEQCMTEAYEGGLVLEGGRAQWEIEKMQKAIAKQLRVIILASPRKYTHDFSQTIDQAIPVIKMKCLTAEEVETWMDMIEPMLESEERSLIQTYGLGVPLLLERLCFHRPITQLAASLQCTAYVQQIIEQASLSGEDRNEDLRTLLADYIEYLVPSDILAKISDTKFLRDKENPIGIITGNLRENGEMPTPQTEEIFIRYTEWLEQRREEPLFEIFVRDMPNAADALQTIGYCDFPEIKTLLKNFIRADHRKGATFYGDQWNSFHQQMSTLSDSSDYYIYMGAIQMARASGVNSALKMNTERGSPIITLQDAPNALHIHKHDHIHQDVMPVAYTIECYLQKIGTPYTVRYNDSLFRFDPETKTYRPMEFVKIDYWQELYGEQWANEEAEPEDQK